MNEIEVKTSTEIQSFIPVEVQEAAIALVSLKALEALAEKQKNWEAVEKASLKILEQQRIIAGEYDKTFSHGQRSDLNSTQNGVQLKCKDWCKALGTSQQTVNRWTQKFLDKDKFIAECEAIKRKTKQLLELHQSASFSSESEEWYTPKKYLDAVHAVFPVDLDPASNAFANQTVKAIDYWTYEDSLQIDTLDRDWHGKVFCNPPYGRHPEYGSLAGAFCNKAIAEYVLGNISECILLINSVHSQNWQAPLYSYVVCFVDHRIQFVSGSGTENKNPTFQNIFVYMGDNKQKFAEAFKPYGYVMELVQ